MCSVDNHQEVMEMIALLFAFVSFSLCLEVGAGFDMKSIIVTCPGHVSYYSLI